MSSAASTLCVQETIKLGKSFEGAKTKAAETSERLLQARPYGGGAALSRIVGVAPPSIRPPSRAPCAQATALSMQETRSSVQRAAESWPQGPRGGLTEVGGAAWLTLTLTLT